ncbi:hypothetical protein DFH09DRAFT_973280 [Mycena vulgaris]|nr:hypothetical protein DFH09DRAFT_973280 [Mycena vulgaris]
MVTLCNTIFSKHLKFGSRAAMASISQVTSKSIEGRIVSWQFQILRLSYSINDGLNYGHAAAIAYKTYRNPLFLQFAIQSWWWGRLNTISQDGLLDARNFDLSTTCQGISMAGGTFREKDPAAPEIGGLSTGTFLVLSALLAEATSDVTYLDAATESANFIRAHLLNSQNVVQDGISGRANDSCAQTGSPVEESYNSALMIEGLAILYSITQNTSVYDLIGGMLTASIPHEAWQGPNGIVTNGKGKSGDMFLPRGLATVYMRNATTPALKSYIQAYLGVQFNAVRDLATTGGSNIYAGSWTGPPSVQPSGADQTTALQVLINAINIDSQSPIHTTPASTLASITPSSSLLPEISTSVSPSRTPMRSAQNIGPIVGGTVGGVVLLAGITIWALLRWRSHRRTSPTINPFDFQSSDPPPQYPRTGKLDRIAQPPSPSGAPAPAVAAVATGPDRASVTPGLAQLPTEDLVRLLFQRIDTGDQEELPGYPTAMRSG